MRARERHRPSEPAGGRECHVLPDMHPSAKVQRLLCGTAPQVSTIVNEDAHLQGKETHLHG